MPQLFSRKTNTLARVTIAGIIAAAFLTLLVMGMVVRSPYITNVNVVREQPVPFSHQHHVQGLGLDCRYCHAQAEVSAYGGIPPVQTCMNCHSQIWTNAQLLQPIRDSYKTGKPIEWNLVHDLPDYVYFNHSIHLNKGVGCSTCHGRVDQMPLMRKANTLQMQWCLDCHRAPEKYIRPRSEIYNMEWTPPKNQLQAGAQLVKDYHVQKLQNCTTCHR